MQARLPIAIATAAVALAACNATITVTPAKPPAPTRKPATAAPAATDVPASAPAATPTPAKSPGLFDEAGLPGTPPPFKFPYGTANQQVDYTLKVKAGAFPLDGSVTIVVRTVTETSSDVYTTLALAASLFGSSGKPTAVHSKIPRGADNPFSLTTLLASSDAPGARSDKSATGLASAAASTIAKWNHEHLVTPAGAFDTDKYLIQQATGADTTQIVLWVDPITGTMVKEQFDSAKPPDLGPSLPIPTDFPLGKTTTTLTLERIGMASPDPAATADLPATQGATGDAGGTPPSESL